MKIDIPKININPIKKQKTSIVRLESRNLVGLSPNAILKELFGYESFRGSQLEIINSSIEENNIFVLMPTGGGKSLCYQIPMLHKPGIGIVISPLIALMKDQVSALQKRKVSAYTLNSSMSDADTNQVEFFVKNKKVDILYVSPEKFISQRFQKLIKEVDVNLIAFDEAHCLSQWGNDFRPSYLDAANLVLTNFPNTPKMALTATADFSTRKDISTRLEFIENNIFSSSFNRENLSIFIRETKGNSYDEIISILDNHKGENGIIYLNNKKKIEKLCDFLKDRGMNVVQYHASLTSLERDFIQEKFMKEDNIIVIATIAFGMGIDKSNIRFVLHADIPSSVEGYYQEIGRAGRDGDEASTYLLYQQKTINAKRSVIRENDSLNEIQRINNFIKLEGMINIIESPSCRKKSLLSYFSEELEHDCQKCDRCLNPKPLKAAKKEAGLVLKTVIQSGERFGTQYLTSLLMGEREAKILSNEHDKISTFGEGAYLFDVQWKSIIRQLLGLGLLAYDPNKLSGIIVTPKGKKILRNSDEVFLIGEWVDSIDCKDDMDFSFRNTGNRNFLTVEIREQWKQLLSILKEELRAEDLRHSEVISIIESQPNSLEDLKQFQGIITEYKLVEIIKIFSVNQNENDIDEGFNIVL